MLNKTHTIGIRIDAETAAWLRSSAEADNRTVSSFVLNALRTMRRATIERLDEHAAEITRELATA